VILEEVNGLYKIVTLKKLRRTESVKFDTLDTSIIPHIDGFDRVIHEPGALSPGSVGEVKRPWYMHQNQEDNLMVLHGKRLIELYSPSHGKIESFSVDADVVCHNDKICYMGAAMLVWPAGVFHRIKSCPSKGSASINFAVRTEDFDIKTNFNIYDVNTETGEYKTIREGHLDQN